MPNPVKDGATGDRCSTCGGLYGAHLLHCPELRSRRRAESIYKATVKATEGLRRLFNGTFDALLACDRE